MLQNDPDLKQEAQNSETQDASDLITLDQDDKHILHSKGRVDSHTNPGINHRVKDVGKHRNNLAMVLAKRMPLNVRQDVINIVEYYEQHMEDQLKQIHRLVKQNKNYERQLELSENKENRIVQPVQPEDASNKQQRIGELEQYVLDKNKQIASLNCQITELLTKLKKYKKRVFQLEARSPIRSVVSEFM